MIHGEVSVLKPVALLNIPKIIEKIVESIPSVSETGAETLTYIADMA